MEQSYIVTAARAFRQQIQRDASSNRAVIQIIDTNWRLVSEIYEDAMARRADCLRKLETCHALLA